MNKVRFGLIGCGKIAQRHANLLSEGCVNNSSLNAVCDINKDRANDFASRYGVQPFYSLEEIGESSEVDALVILTPSGLHAENALKLAKYKKPIIIEKPIAMRLADAEKIINICDINNIKLFVVKQNRFNIPILKLRNAINAERFGKLVLGTIRLRWSRDQDYYDAEAWRGTWEHDGGVLTNQSSHLIDLLLWFMGDVESVFAKASNALVNIEAEDTAVVTIKFTNGALGLIEATTATRPKDLEGSISILGEKGAVVIGGYAANELITWQFNDQNKNDEIIINKHSKNPDHKYGYAHKEYYNNISDCLINNKKQLVDGNEGIKSLRLLSAIYESIESKKEIYMKNFSPIKCKLGRKN